MLETIFECAKVIIAFQCLNAKSIKVCKYLLSAKAQPLNVQIPFIPEYPLSSGMQTCLMIRVRHHAPGSLSSGESEGAGPSGNVPQA